MTRVNIDKMTNFSEQFAEAYKSLRTNIEFCGQEQKVIAITSCVPNEGKSTVSFNVAAAFAETGKKVILVDADLRKSVLLGKLQIRERIMGLTNFLAGQCPAGDAICTTNYPRLHLIVAGSVAPNPSELLGSQKFSALIQQLRDYYDYVIIDTPPLGSVIDGAVVARECDGAALVIASNTVSYKFAARVKEQLSRANCKILGVILNKVDMGKNSYYGKYYGKYYGQY